MVKSTWKLNKNDECCLQICSKDQNKMTILSQVTAPQTNECIGKTDMLK